MKHKLLLLCMGLLSCISYAQLNAYTFTTSSGNNLDPMTGATQIIASSVDDGASAVFPIGFSFTFNGGSFANMSANSNGIARLGPTAATNQWTNSITSTTFNPKIMPAWDDLATGSDGFVSTVLIGTAPNQIRIVEWFLTIPRVTTGAANGRFQLWLYEGTNVVEFRYGAAANAFASATIGISNATATTGDYVSINDTAAHTVSTTVPVNNLTVWPGAGRAYTFTPPACAAPGGIVASQITTTTASVAYNNPNDNSNVEYIVLPVADPAPTGAGTAATSSPFSVMGLSPNTTYAIYVRASCGMAGFSSYSAAVTFTTACDSFTALNENFDALATGSIVPACWERLISGTGSQTITSTTPASGTRNIFQSSSSPANATIVVLPQFSNVTAGTHRLKIKFRATATTGELELGYLTDRRDASTFVLIQTIPITNTAYGPETIFTNFSTVPGGASLGIRNNGTSTVSHYWDDVVWEAIPSCVAPSMLAASTITPTTAIISWTENNTTAAASWEYVVQEATLPAPTGAGTTSPTNTVNLTMLTPATSYNLYVRAACGTSDFSVYSGPFPFATPCAIVVPDILEPFNTFVPACWSQATSGDLSTGPTGFGSSDWFSEEFAHLATSGGGAVNINLYRNVASDWIVSPLYDLSAGGYELNLDVALTDYDEAAPGVMGSDDRVVLAYTTDGTTWIALKTWDVNNQPPTAGETYNNPLSGIAGASVRFGIYATDGAIDDVGIDYDFHVDNFQLRTPPTCPDTSNLSLVNTTDTTATINFDSGNATSSGNYEYAVTTMAATAPAVTGSWTDVAGSMPNVTYTILGLTAQTQYFIYVREVCAVGDESAWSLFPLNVTTQCIPETMLPVSVDFTLNLPNSCWSEAGSGEIAAGPSGFGASDWRAPRQFTDAGGTLVNSNAINLYQNIDREWLISEPYDLTGTAYNLAVTVAVTNWNSNTVGDTMGSDDSVTLLITQDGGLTWTTLTTWTVANQPLVTGTEFIADLSAYTGIVQIAFMASDGAVDDIEDYDFHVGRMLIQSTAGTNDVSLASSIKLYPNPVNGDTLTIVMDNATVSGLVNVTIINTLGQSVKSQKLNQVGNAITLDNMATLNSGVYFVTIETNAGNATLKFIKE